MSISYFLTEISKIWQRNDHSVAGDKWVELQELFMDQVLIQFENKSKKFSEEKIEFTFLPDQSIAMKHRLKEFLCTIFLLDNSHTFFESEVVNSCLRVTISKKNLTSLIAAANVKRRNKHTHILAENDLQFEEKSYTRSTSTVIENKVCKKRKREEEKEKALENFILSQKKTDLPQKKKIPKPHFRCLFNDFLTETKTNLYLFESELDEVLHRLYQGSVVFNSPDYVLAPLFPKSSSPLLTLRT
jgi:hypothetical protein